jgi:diguanylate cyclase (GGDEF)-like protein
MLDVDGFKHFNDVYGHAAGDTILHRLGGMLLGQVRGEEIPARYGGDEFILVMPDASREVTRERADSIRENACHINISLEGWPLDNITLSMGIAVFPEDGSTSAAVLRAADKALYRAKREGRNRVGAAE